MTPTVPPSPDGQAPDAHGLPQPAGSGAVECASRLTLASLPGLPLVGPGDDLATLALEALHHAGLSFQDQDVLVVTSKIVSRSENRFVDLSLAEPSARAVELAATIDRDPRLIELVLRESHSISRVAPGVLVVRHRLGFVLANAGIDASNAEPASAPAGSGPWVLLLPEDPDRSARAIRDVIEAQTGVRIGVVISDSFGRPFRLGTVGAAIGAAGLPTLFDQRGRVDLFGRVLQHTETALADQIAAAADLIAGQAAEGRAMTLVRGLSFPPGDHPAGDLNRPYKQDLYA